MSESSSSEKEGSEGGRDERKGREEKKKKERKRKEKKVGKETYYIASRNLFSVITYMGKESEKEWLYMYVYG